MAIINIPMGGTSVAIDVPDFAMDATLQDLLQTSRTQLSTMQNLIGITASHQNQQSRSATHGEEKIAKEVAKSSKKGSFENKTLMEVFQEGSAPLKGSNLSSIVQGLGEKIPFIGGLAGGLSGFVLQTLEQFGNSLALTSRVGVGLTTSLGDVRDAAATMGLNLEQFGKMAVENGRALAAFGGNTEDGYKRLAKLTDAFSQATLNVGHFGLGADEMNQVLLDEIELRRVTLGQESLAAMNLNELAQSVKDNRVQQLAMARLTGQDVRERMAAQKELQANVIAQEYMTGATEETREKLNALSSGLSKVPGGDKIRDALISSIATGVDPRAFEGRLFALMGPQAQGLIDFVQSNISGGMSSGQFTRDFEYLSAELREAGGGMGNGLSVLAAFGDAEAAQVLAIRNQTMKLGKSQEEFNTEYNKALDFMLNTTNMSIAGMNGQFDRLSSRFSARAMDFASALLGGLDEPDAGDSILGTMNKFSDMLDSQPVKDFVTRTGEVANELAKVMGQLALMGIDMSTPGDLTQAFENVMKKFDDNGMLKVRVQNINEFPVTPSRN
jgi:hypothetical protein